MKRMRIFIDLDDVLMDTRAFKEVFFEAFAAFGVSKDIVRKAYLDTRETKESYNLRDHLHNISKSVPGLNIKDAGKELLVFSRRSAEFIFPDAISFLTYLRENGWRAELVSTGDKKMQLGKIKALGIENFFARIHFADSNKKSRWVRTALHHPKDFFVFLDDKAEAVDDVKKEFPESAAIQILRRKNQKKSAGADAIVENLKEARKILSEKYAKKKN